MKSKQLPSIEEDKLPSDEEAPLDRSCESTKSKRGRPAVPNQWTRVVNVDNIATDKIRAWQIATDLLLEDAMPQPPMRRRLEQEWTLHFHPSQWTKDNPNRTIEGSRLSEHKLLKYAKQISSLREVMRERAAKLSIGKEAEKQSTAMFAAKM